MVRLDFDTHAMPAQERSDVSQAEILFVLEANEHDVTVMLYGSVHDINYRRQWVSCLLTASLALDALPYQHCIQPDRLLFEFVFLLEHVALQL